MDINLHGHWASLPIATLQKYCIASRWSQRQHVTPVSHRLMFPLYWNSVVTSVPPFSGYPSCCDALGREARPSRLLQPQTCSWNTLVRNFLHQVPLPRVISLQHVPWAPRQPLSFGNKWRQIMRACQPFHYTPNTAVGELLPYGKTTAYVVYRSLCWSRITC